MVSYAKSTYEKSKKFNEKLKELQRTIKPIIIRTYFAIDAKQNDELKTLSCDLSEDERIQLDELKALRMDGIQSEMKYALAQAKKNKIQLSEEIILGKLIVSNFNKELLEKVPSLGVYNLFILFTEEELDRYL